MGSKLETMMVRARLSLTNGSMRSKSIKGVVVIATSKRFNPTIGRTPADVTRSGHKAKLVKMIIV